MKRNCLIIGAVSLLVLSLSACANNGGTNSTDNAAKLLTEVKTTQFFTDEIVADGDVEKILSAGINAPSAMNTQPWHFTAVTDKETMQKLADAMSSMKPPAMKDGDFPMPPKAPEGMEGKQPPAEAQLLGYGTKIMTAPAMVLNNDEYKEMLSVPEGQKIAAVLIVGKAATEKENPDVVSSATTRNDFDGVVTIISE